MSLSRRQFLARGSAFSLGFFGLRAALRAGALEPETPGYGPLVADPKQIFDLPAGFTYRAFSHAGEEMDDGLLVPSYHDGMAAFPGKDGRVILVRNHELDIGWFKHSAFGPTAERLGRLPRDRFYNYGFGKTPALGGTTTVVYDPATGRVERQFMSLAGTMRNCAGGPTPWGSWLTCEEWTGPSGEFSEKPHGFVFEVPASATSAVDPVPLSAMGRFYREAVAVDPASGCVYQTEDLGDGLIYRFIPKVPGKLAAGGKLQALSIRGQRSADLRNWKARTIAPGATFEIDWIDLDDVHSPKDDLRLQGFSKGAAVFARNEGMWYGRGSVFFCATNGGFKQKGQVWRYTPSPLEGKSDEPRTPGKLELFIESPDPSVIENADNITVAPWGDLIVCEDEVTESDKIQHLVGIRPDGRTYRLGRNAMGKSELAGATFSPDGSVLFLNIQRPGLTLAITGPWQR